MKYPNTEVFSIPVGAQLGLDNNEDVFVLYSPLCDGVALIDENDEALVRRYFEKGVVLDNEALEELIKEFGDTAMGFPEIPDIEKTTRMSLLPNSACNFSCTYCYSSKGRSSAVISWEKAKSALDYFINSERVDASHLSLFISGGGEPLLSWNITRKVVEYASGRAKDEGFTLQISIITNGSLLTDEVIQVLKDYDCTVCVSFEVLEELQNLHRRNFSVVEDNILKLGEHKVKVLLNSTIIPQSVGFMKEMAGVVAEKYSFVSQYTMEPVTSTALFASPQELHDFYDRFYEGYIEAKTIAERSGLNLRFTFDDAFRGITIRHCPGKFCITPQGTVSICHLISSPQEDRYEQCIYGEVLESGRIRINKKYYDQLYKKNVFVYGHCTDCFAKWSCGGECMTRNETYPEEYMKEVCCFNKRFVLHLLMKRIENSVRENFDLSLYEYVRQTK